MSVHKYTLQELRNLQEDDELDLSASQIKEFPTQIVQLSRLTKLDLNTNSLVFLPDSFCKMTKLIRLDLGKNRLHHLPNDFGNLSSLQHLSLFDNELEDLPLSFSKLKSLKWLDLKKNPLNSRLSKLAGNCGTTKECEKAAKQVVEVYMGEQQKAIDNRKAQEAKLQAKVQKAKEEERMKKHQEKKAKEAEEKKEKDAKQSASGNSKAQHQQQQNQQKAAAHNKNHKDSSPKGGNRKDDDKKKTTQKPRGFFRGLFSFIYSCIWYLALILVSSATLAIALDCNKMGSPVPGNQPLCKDFSSLAAFKSPSAAFGQNLKKSYSAVFTGYHNQAKPHIAPAQKWISKKWAEFVKTDIGKKVEQVLYKIHTFIVDIWVKVQRFVVTQWNDIVAWWKKDGHKQFAPVIEGFWIGFKMVFNIVIDIARNIGALFVYLAARAKTFFLAWSDGGFNAAMNTLNH